MSQSHDHSSRHRHSLLLRWRMLWTALNFAVGAAAATLLVIAIVFYVRESWLAGVLSTVGSILSGGIVQWLQAGQAQASREEEKAFQQAAEDSRKQAESDRGRDANAAFIGRKNVS